MISVIHLCRSIDYLGGVEIVVKEFTLNSNERLRHTICCIQGQEGSVTKELRNKGIFVVFLQGENHIHLKQILDDIHFDIIHVHFFLAEKILKKIDTSIPIICTKYCDYSLDHAESKGVLGKVKKMYFDFLLQKRISRNYSATIVINEKLENYWSKYTSTTRVPVSTIRATDLNSNPLGKNRNNFFIASRLVREKRHDLVLNALKNFPTLQLDIYGEGPLKSKYLEMRNRFNLNNVRFVGTVSNSTMKKEMGNYDVMILSSETEGLPLLIQEAQSLGCIVIASNIPGNRELLSNSQELLFKKNNSDDLVEKIQYFLNLSTSDRNRIRESEQQKYCEFYNLENTTNQIIATYERALLSGRFVRQ